MESFLYTFDAAISNMLYRDENYVLCAFLCNFELLKRSKWSWRGLQRCWLPVARHVLDIKVNIDCHIYITWLPAYHILPPHICVLSPTGAGRRCCMNHDSEVKVILKHLPSRNPSLQLACMLVICTTYL